MVDVADTLRAERELLASVLSTIPHLVFWKDLDHRYLGCNDAYSRLRGLADPYELKGRREAELPEHPLGALIAEIEDQVLASETAVVDRPVVLAAEDGSPVAMLLTVLTRYENGLPGGVMGVGTDVTRITALERQVAQASRLESIGQLAAGLAHEINTPVQYVSDNVRFLADSLTEVFAALRELRSAARAGSSEQLQAQLASFVEALDLDFLSAEIPSALEQSLEGVDRVADIVRAMKEFSHPGQGRTDTDVNHAVQTTVQVSRNEWKYLAVVEVDLDPSVGLVPCFEGELKQVILNLIVNAAHAVGEQRQKAGSSALGCIRISTRRTASAVLVSISDDGIGMDDAVREHIFDPFFTTKEVGKGTGQGLALAHSSIVGKHGGAIDVVSAPGAGSTFTLRVPTRVES